MPASANDAVPGDPGSRIVCALAASAWVSFPTASLSSLRSQVAAAYPDTLTAGTLKQADEQSLVALLAVRRALDDAELHRCDCEYWALVAAPRALGRKRVAESLVKFRQGGAWSVSPHIIPHCSLHSLPGLLSQALQQHGPNLGVGGMPGAEREAFWAAMPLLQGDDWPGVWIVMTGWERESASGEQGLCQAAVLGLQRADGRAELPLLTFGLAGASKSRVPFSLEAVGKTIRQRADACWDLGAGDLGGVSCSLTYSPAVLGKEAAA